MNTQGAAALLQSLKNPCDPLPTHGKGRRNKKIALPTFTEREKEVITHIANGLTNREIAIAIGISIKTVEKHRQNLMDKSELRNTAAITRYAIANRFIKLEKYA